MAAPVFIEDAIILKVTDKALLVEISEQEYWIPKSQLHDENEITGEGEVGTLAITEWIAQEKGLL